MKVYIAGPVTGLPEGNRPQFQRVARTLVALGHDPIDPTAKTVPGDDHAPVGSARYEQIMEGCFEDVASSDALCLLDGWEQSAGARRELALAHDLDLIVVPERDIIRSLKPRRSTAEPVLAIRWIGHSDYKPVRQYDGDAGFDLIVSEDVDILPGEFIDVACGIDGIELPPGFWAMVTGRSSTLRKRKVLVAQGIIDNGWRGPIYAGCQNLSPTESAFIGKGERVAQLLVFKLEAHRLGFDRVAELSESDRGTSGFGSTGL